MVNPGFLSYKTPFNTDLAKPTALVVTGVGNRYDPSFQSARTKGTEVYAYLHTFDGQLDPKEPVAVGFYTAGNAKDHLWGNGRSNWPGTVLLDIRVGSPWVDWVETYLANLIAEDKFDGVFLDSLGARLWGPSAFDTWPAAERAEFTAGAVDLARRLDKVRRETNPFFKIIHNNFWHLPPTDPSQLLARSAEAYCDGVCLEHSPLSAFHTAYANRAFGNLGQRRVIAVASTVDEAKKWALQPGVTHVTYGSDYGVAQPPVVSYSDISAPELRARVSYLEGKISYLNGLVSDLDKEVELLELDAKKQKALLDQYIEAINKIKDIVSG